MRTALVLVFSLALATAAAAQSAVSGVVRDEAGGAVSGASVSVLGTSGPRTADSDRSGWPVHPLRCSRRQPDDGRPRGRICRVVRVGGALRTKSSVVLKIATLFETVTVTPTRTEKRLGDVPVSANIVEKETIRQSPAVVADDVLRQVPTFSLFRRSSSLSSHPTAQGVSLRGIGPSGVSRTLVLVDGVPFNDPFGGWVYWTRVPLESVDRIEVIDGSSSSLYGNYGMGGVINIIPHACRGRRTLEFKTQYGNHNSPKADFFASDVWGKLGVAVEGERVRHRRLPDRDRQRARDHRQQRPGQVRELQRQGGLSARTIA